MEEISRIAQLNTDPGMIGTTKKRFIPQKRTLKEVALGPKKAGYEPR
jgi:hypothetical protein